MAVHREGDASLCIEAESFVAGVLKKLDLNYKQEKLSKEIKNALRQSGISERIDEVVKKVLPEQSKIESILKGSARNFSQI